MSTTEDKYELKGPKSVFDMACLELSTINDKHELSELDAQDSGDIPQLVQNV